VNNFPHYFIHSSLCQLNRWTGKLVPRELVWGLKWNVKSKPSTQYQVIYFYGVWRRLTTVFTWVNFLKLHLATFMVKNQYLIPGHFSLKRGLRLAGSSLLKNCLRLEVFFFTAMYLNCLCIKAKLWKHKNLDYFIQFFHEKMTTMKVDQHSP